MTTIISAVIGAILGALLVFIVLYGHLLLNAIDNLLYGEEEN